MEPDARRRTAGDLPSRWPPGEWSPVRETSFKFVAGARVTTAEPTQELGG